MHKILYRLVSMYMAPFRAGPFTVDGLTQHQNFIRGTILQPLHDNTLGALPRHLIVVEYRRRLATSEAENFRIQLLPIPYNTYPVHIENVPKIQKTAVAAAHQGCLDASSLGFGGISNLFERCLFLEQVSKERQQRRLFTAAKRSKLCFWPQNGTRRRMRRHCSPYNNNK